MCLAHSDGARAGARAVRAFADNHPSAAVRDGHQGCDGQIILGVNSPCCLASLSSGNSSGQYSALTHAHTHTHNRDAP